MKKRREGYPIDAILEKKIYSIEQAMHWMNTTGMIVKDPTRTVHIDTNPKIGNYLAKNPRTPEESYRFETLQFGNEEEKEKCEKREWPSNR